VTPRFFSCARPVGSRSLSRPKFCPRSCPPPRGGVSA
jgi:hypothetical protein